ncbi:MAG: site-specific DNA-methyltransferase [Desulfobacterales bacterium]|nr:site-specific DNA-methyltransferase [Desulfobacterales bacterium]
MKKLTEQDGKSLDMVNKNFEALKIIFPEAFTEDGVDFEVLRELLGDSVAEGEEKYGLNWHGKKKARQIALMPSLGTLRPCPEESVDWDTTQNLFIEGDNLEVLKLLQKSYANKVKMIYIDPPYNTGKEFIYPDKFQDNLDTYLRYTGQKDDEGFKISSNTESSGRYHTNWLNMMLPRLKLARGLLKDDGVIFISIDDNEDSNLRQICNEVFGEENFLSKIVIQSNKRGQTYKQIAKCHEYLFVYYKSDNSSLGELEKDDGSLPFEDNDGAYDLWELRNRNPKFGKHNRPNLFYPIYIDPDSRNDDGLFSISLDEDVRFTVKVLPKNSQGEDSCWRWGKKKVLKDGIEIVPQVLFGKMKRDGGWNIYEKSRKNTTKAKSIWMDTGVISEQGTVEAGRIGMGGMLEFPKPLELIKRCVQLGSGDGDVVMDFFTGSGTTAHAVLQQCLDDRQRRRCISVQLPEPTYEYKDGKKVAKTINKKAFEAGYKTIADIGKERIRRAGAKIKEENPEYEGDLGFKVFKLDSSNIRAWNPDRNDLEQTLLEHMEHLVEGRSEEDVLYELLLKRGVDLTVPIKEKTITGKTVYSIGYGVLFACLDTSISREQIEDLAMGIIDWHKELKPAGDTQVVFRDSAFANDIAKTNMTAILEQNGIKHVRSL